MSCLVNRSNLQEFIVDHGQIILITGELFPAAIDPTRIFILSANSFGSL